ncbi:hypothetical protein [Mycobacteroides abscessus]|uniref:hypothetical protein n=1 Tax=Mycobacteroides abscessus TaxID=36809 RepID=UPI00266DD661|nr:hypothetical protein [Mycobacteroides abscessus]MDO3331519.1 hypothetical protein [Mycobacteroides abscessus subsp. abscessus]
MFDTRRLLEDVIARIPNLLSITRVEKFETEPHEVIHTQREVAARIAAVLPGILDEHGCRMVQVRRLEPGDGCSLRVPVSNRPWADAEIRVAIDRDQLVVLGLPARLPVGDSAAVAGALLAIDAAVERMRRRGCRPFPISPRRTGGRR